MRILGKNDGREGVFVPSMNDVLNLVEHLQNSKIRVQANRCVVVRNRNASCRRCAEVCPTECIEYVENEPRITPDRCIGCGTCAAACPTEAIEPRDPNDAEFRKACFAAMTAADGHAVIACSRLLAAAEGRYDATKVVGASCLGRTNVSLLMELAAAGAKRITLVEGRCGECPHAKGLEAARAVVAETAQLLETWGSDTQVVLAEKLPGATRAAAAASHDESKRRFFTDMRREAKAAAAVTADYAVKETFNLEEPPKHQKVADNGAIPYVDTPRRDRLRTALGVLGKPADVLLETGLWGHLEIDPDKCRGCRICATFCPTGAIERFGEEPPARGGLSYGRTRKDEGDDKPFGVTHTPGRCVQCRMCEDVCIAKALELVPEVFATDLIDDNAYDRFEMKKPSVKGGLSFLK